MTWLYVTILVYLILAFVNLVDKHLLNSAIPDPKVYSFYVGILGALAVVLAPFTGFYLAGFLPIILGLAAGVCFIYGLFWLYKGLHSFEASRVIPAVGGLTPIFTFVLIYLFSPGSETLPLGAILAFLLLVAGSVIIVSERGKFVNLKSLKMSAVAAAFLSLSFVFSKYLYIEIPFWTGFIYKSIGGALLALLFFAIFPEIKQEVFKKKEKSSRKTAVIFLSNQAAGGVASILQNWAVALAPLAYVAFVNALQGVQYAFLFIFAIFLSVKFPRILEEEVSRKVIIQKIGAIVIIGVGLAILSLNK